ncbi:MAG: hypothetical protein IT379_20505, partial [Deltaproteobacteria bacterium]|nr:hypothetical protein [Deltaproteobacteria bacterium]
MKLRTAAVIVSTLALARGCSCGAVTARMSATDAETERDGAAEPGDAAPPRGPPSCVAWCEGVSLVAALDFDRRLRIDAIDGLALSASATSGAALLRRDGGDAGARHVIATFDGVSGRADLGEEAATLPLHDGISGQAFRANAAGYQEVLAYPSTDAATGVALGEVGWLEDGSVARQTGLLAVLPTRLSPCSCERPVAVATATDGEIALAAVVEGASVLYGMLRGTALGEMGTLLDLRTSSPPGAAPVSVHLLADERVALAWGGFAYGLEPRAAGLAVGRIGVADWTRVDLPGTPYDPGPVVTDSVSGIAVVRFVSDANDVGRSGIRITRYDDTTLAALDATDIPTPFGLQPRSIALLESSNGPGVAFVEPGASREVDNLYVV